MSEKRILNDELKKYGNSDYYPFHMPGHKRNPYIMYGEFPVERDITEIEGFDNLHHPEDILKEVFSKYDSIIVGCYNSPAQMMAILMMRLFRIPYILNMGVHIQCLLGQGKKCIFHFFS